MTRAEIFLKFGPGIMLENSPAPADGTCPQILKAKWIAVMVAEAALQYALKKRYSLSTA